MIDWREEVQCFDKPLGWSSFDVIRYLRSEYRKKFSAEKAPKMGHAGTLDPLASGLMLIGIGKGTKQLAHLTKLDKVYEAEIVLGVATSTGDREGEIVAEVDMNTIELSQREIVAVLNLIIGTHELPVSLYSAIKIDGIPLYKRVRRAAKSGAAHAIPAPVRAMTVYAAELLDYDYSVAKYTPALATDEQVKKILARKFYQSDFFDINAALHLDKSFLVSSCWRQRRLVRVRFHVASGTYIRSLAAAVGERLRCPASLYALRRVSVGHYALKI